MGKDILQDIGSWKVKLPLPRHYEDVRNEETGEWEDVCHDYGYEFTVSEVLNDIMTMPMYDIWLDSMLRYNIGTRNALRAFGVRKVINRLLKIAPDNKTVVDAIKNYPKNYKYDRIGNLDIQVYSSTEDVVLFGQTLHGISDIHARVERALSPIEVIYGGKPEKIRRQKRDGIHVGVTWEYYPKFDVYDSDDDGSYDNFIIRDHHIADIELKQLGKYPGSMKVDEHMPEELLPMIYHDHNSRFMLVATHREEI